LSQIKERLAQIRDPREPSSCGLMCYLELNIDVFNDSILLSLRATYTISTVVVSFSMCLVQCVWLEAFCMSSYYDFVYLALIWSSLLVVQVVDFLLLCVT